MDETLEIEFSIQLHSALRCRLPVYYLLVLRSASDVFINMLVIESNYSSLVVPKQRPPLRR